MQDADDGYRYWRYVETPSGDLLDGDLDMLRRIDPEGVVEDTADAIDLEGAWTIAAADIVAAHNARTDLRG